MGEEEEVQEKRGNKTLNFLRVFFMISFMILFDFFFFLVRYKAPVVATHLPCPISQKTFIGAEPNDTLTRNLQTL